MGRQNMLAMIGSYFSLPHLVRLYNREYAEAIYAPELLNERSCLVLLLFSSREFMLMVYMYVLSRVNGAECTHNTYRRGFRTALVASGRVSSGWVTGRLD